MKHYTTHIDVESGTFISLPGAGYYPPVNDKIKGLKIFGKSEQVQTARGKNLYNSDVTTGQTINGVTISYNSTTKEIMLNGIAMADLYLINNLIEPIALSGAYIVKYWYGSGSISAYAMTTGFINDGGSYVLNSEAIGTANYSTNVTRAVPSVAAVVSKKIQIYAGAGTVFSNLKFKISIESGSTAMTTFEAYIANTPSPYVPSTINSVASGFNLMSCGKNLVDFKNVTRAKDTSYVIENSSIYVTSIPEAYTSYIAFSVILPKAKNYTVAVKVRVLSGSTSSPSSIMLRETLNGGALYGSCNFNNTVTDWQTAIINIPSQDRLPLIYLWLYNKTENKTSNNFVVEYSEIRVYEGTYTVATMPAYTPYAGNTYPYQFKDTDGTLHNLNSLPELDSNGVPKVYDEYRQAENKLIKRVKVLTVSSGTGWVYNSNNGVSALICYSDNYNVPDITDYSINVRCSVATPGISGVNVFYVDFKENITTMLRLRIPVGELISLDDAGAAAWINNQISLHGNIVFMYEYATPQTYDIKPYNASTFAYNDIPYSVQWINNIYTDSAVQPEIQGEIRKLGNRAIAEYQLYTTSGDLLQCYRENFINVNDIVTNTKVTISDWFMNGFTETAKNMDTLRYVEYSTPVLPAGTYTFNRTFAVLAGTSVLHTGRVDLYSLGALSITLASSEKSITFTLSQAKPIRLTFYLCVDVVLTDLLSVKFSDVYFCSGDSILDNLFVRI